jgi:CPA2 family monovalent cation:H+ antiporter-2
VVLLRALQERRLIETERGRIAVGWLIVEDLAMVLALVLLPALAGVLGGTPAAAIPHDRSPCCLARPRHLGRRSAVTLRKVAAFVVVMLVSAAGHPLDAALRRPHRLARTVPPAVLAIALGVAFGAAKLFGVSLALGAFFAGMIMSESELSHRRRRNRCRCATPSRCCSSSRSACCSIR